MPGATLQAAVQPIAYQAYIATFQGELDRPRIASKFANKFSQLFATGVTSYIATCTGLPVGGPITAGPTATLEQSLFEAGRQALIETFQGESDPKNIAIKFGNGFKPYAAAVAAWIPTNLTVPASPPVLPLSPGGPVIAMTSASTMPVMFACAQQAFINTFEGEADLRGIALMFANIMQNAGNLLYTYMQTCSSLPGGGPIVTP